MEDGHGRSPFSLHSLRYSTSLPRLSKDTIYDNNDNQGMEDLQYIATGPNPNLLDHVKMFLEIQTVMSRTNVQRQSPSLIGIRRSHGGNSTKSESH